MERKITTFGTYFREFMTSLDDKALKIKAEYYGSKK